MACLNDNTSFLRMNMDRDICYVDHTSNRTNNQVNIREFDDTIINPDPVIQDEDTEQLMEDYLSPQKLKSLTGNNSLNNVSYLEMVVDTTENSLGNFGNMVENLTQLKLSNSVIASVRDLGTSLSQLQTLWMAKCGLYDLDGISSLSSIKELYLAYNNITDVSPVSMLDTLQILDLESNLVEDMAQVEFLVLCPELKRLTLEGNPVCMKPQPDCTPEVLAGYNYRVEVHKVLPNLKYLDDDPFLFDLVNGTRVLKITPAQQQNTCLREKLNSDWTLVTERIKTLDDDTESQEVTTKRPNSATRPGSASRQRPSSARPGSARQRPGSARKRPGTALQRPGTAAGQRPSTASSENISFEEDDCSDLTHGLGSVICGNPSRALKARRKILQENEEVDRLVLDTPSSPSQQNDILVSEIELCDRNLFEELKSWRREYARFLDRTTDYTIIEDEENEQIPVHDSFSENIPDSAASSSLSPTPPDKPHSSSPPTSATRRVARIRQSYPLPKPPDGSEGRPRTAADFRDRLNRAQGARLRRTADSHGDSVEDTPITEREGEPRAMSAPINSRGLTPSENPHSSLENRSGHTSERFVRKVRPRSARFASQKTQQF